ncbi:MAG: hypothetical protein B6244_14205 [Candidatus Cloacimonetes bacterium 4572_55]|nr:MAG: hypothetical protein B6244_14205 [Candidatus Cloacimonetes bacterium 4572_55]
MKLTELYENMIMALQALRANTARSLLTTLGIVIGIGATIGITALTEGMNRSMISQVENLGLNYFQLLRYGGGVQFGFVERKPRPRITLEDGEAIRKLCPSVGKVVPTMYTSRTVVFEDKSRRSEFCGTVPEYQEVEGYYTERGRFLSHADVEHRRMVCVLGASVTEDLFPHEDPIGKTVSTGGLKFFVIGVLQEKGSIFGNNPDIYINIPATTFEKYYGKFRSVNISIEPVSFELMDKAMEETRTVMRQRRKLRYRDLDNFAVMKNDQILKTLQRLTQGAFMVVIGVTGLSLLVGSIGIMNIMLVSVTERTREIGIRKAVGAKQSDILFQFLTEAVILSVLGGIIGVLVGVGVGVLVSSISPIDYAMPLWVILLGVAVSAGVGVASGFYPAFRAARLDPIESLRYE